jgi:hypothetical protein
VTTPARLLHGVATFGAVGAWGTGIFQEDIACDVRNEFRELIGSRIDTEDATERLRSRYLDGAEDGAARRAAV